MPDTAPALRHCVDHLQTTAASGRGVDRLQAGFEHRPVVHLDNDGRAVETHRELRSSASVIHSIGDQFVRDEQDRLELRPGDTPQPKLVGETEPGKSGRGRNRHERPAHLADHR